MSAQFDPSMFLAILPEIGLVVLAAVILTVLGTNTFSPSLINGDCDNNNLINTDDYLILSGAFDTLEGDPGYEANADLNLDDIVNTDDYLILSNNFDLVGD